MADTKYSLINAAEMTLGEVSQSVTVKNSAPIDGLSQALNTSTLKIGLLTTAIESLNLTLSLQRSMLRAPVAEAKNALISGQAAVDKLPVRIEPPDILKPAIAMDSALAELRSAAQLTRPQSEGMAQSNLQMATAPMVAAGGTTAVDLTRLESLAASAGIGKELANASDRQFELLHFASDAAVTASAFKVPAMEVGEMMAGWRTAMKLNSVQAFDLADATHHLGKIPGGARAADVGAILQRHGSEATAAGLMPEQAAALTAALLNTGTQKGDAGSAFKSIITALGKGDQVSAKERAAWSQLGIDPREVAGLLRDKDQAPGAVMSVLAALNAKPVENRSMLATTLFSNGDEAALRLSQNLADVNEAFWQVKDKRQYATSELGDKGSIRQSALAQSTTRQGQLNIFNAQSDRLSTVTGDALAPVSDIALSSLGSLADSLSDLAKYSSAATAVIVLAAAAVKSLVGWLSKAVVDEMANRAAKRVLGGAAARLRRRSGGVPAEGLRGEFHAGTQEMNANPGTGSTDKLNNFSGGREVRAPGARYALSPVAALRPLAGKAFGPLKIIGAVADVAEGVVAGDARMVGAGLGAAGGGWAGASAGSLAGAVLGSFVPVVGTAIGGLLGGLIGGWLGSESGASLGAKLATPAADRLGSPAQVSNDLTNTRTDNQPITFNSTIQINGQDLASARELANLVVQTTLGQLGQLMPTNALATRRDTALTDGAV